MKKLNSFLGTGFALSLALVFLVSASSASAAVENITIGENMTVGSTGSDVVVLQGLLSELGYLNVPINVPLGYFGALTQKAVSTYQAAQGVTPTAGYFGPVTKLAMHQEFATHNWLGLLNW